MAVPDLNEDVLTIVCVFLTNVSDVCAISLTCSSFRPVAIRRLLSMHPVHLTGDASIRRFHAFLFADTAARAPLIHALDIETGSSHRLRPPQPGDASLLIDILTSCQHLERISFRRVPYSPRLTEDPGVIDAIASIQSLRSLSIQSPSVDALTLVRKVSAPLRKLGLWCFYRDDSEVEFNWYPAGFQESLSHLASTLEEIGFHELIVDPDKIQELQDSEGPTPPLSSTTQYPAVRSLSVNSFTGRLLLEPLQHLFPALDGTLTVGRIDLDYIDDTVYSDMRAANQRAQENKNGDDSPSRRWKKLDRVVCDAVPFYILGLRCPMRLAVLDARDDYYTAEFMRRCITVALRENPVPRLTLSLALNDGLGVLDGLFGPELGATLTHLALVLDTVGLCPPVPPAVPPFGWDALLDKMLSLLRPLHKLTHLRIVFHSECPEDPGTDASTPPMLVEALARALRPSMFDFQGTAMSLLPQLPSLESLFLTTCGYYARREKVGDATRMVPTSKRWSISRAWHVAERNANGMQDGEPTLVELHDEGAEAIIQREELVLSQYEVWFSKSAD